MNPVLDESSAGVIVVKSGMLLISALHLSFSSQVQVTEYAETLTEH